MKKIYKKLSAEQKAEDIIFTSTLSTSTTELETDTTHIVTAQQTDADEVIARLKDDSFFNGSGWKYNIIRT